MASYEHDTGTILQLLIVGAAALGAVYALARGGARAQAASRIAAVGILIFAIALIVVGGRRFAERRASSDVMRGEIPDPLPAAEKFVSSAECMGCHPAHYDSWHRSYHRTMTQAATPAAVLGEFDDVGLTSRRRSYHLTRRGDEYWVNMVDPEWEQSLVARGTDPVSVAGAPRVDRRVVMTTGAHHMQTYWVGGARDGQLFNLPFVWLNEEARWAPREDVFLRPEDLGRQFGTWHNNCVECHCVAGEQGFDTNARTFEPSTAELGIACEACHGPGEEHVRANSDMTRRYQMHLAGGVDTTIVNPSRLSVRAATDVCAQCHSMNIFKTDPRVPGERYRAGGELIKTKMILRTSDRRMSDAERADWPRLRHHISRQYEGYLDERFWSDGMARVSGRETNGMVESACFEGGAMSCLSCHSMHNSDPNDQLKQGMDGDEACYQCHPGYRARVEQHTHHKPGSSGSACMNCHMPHTTYGLLKGIRSHLIDSPSVAAELETGRPNACNLCHLDKTLAWAADTLAAWYEQPVPELPENAATTSDAVVRLLTGDAGQRAIVAWHAGWSPAQEASGRGWIAPFLAHLLQDPYACVRFIASRALRGIPGCENLQYDFVGDAEQRARARREVEARFAALDLRARERVGRDVLTDAAGNLDAARFAALAAARDDRVIDLRE
ncbi:MAG: cytochrome c3 family protein [bacterium]